ncbi:MAG: 23S rRNA (guanosine(2251)-2'-O)-methyltransferase RlmB [Holosporaceae bacterium]|jgi:23S rRNA (guanosine2251-2'-O)-methyltransferase|nr:23S rRNA (guanosine(2251)-2'-O)-methyltransferase RlmB [Holosporaceae bacterium]
MWIYGRHAVKSALLNEKREILRLVLLESFKDFSDKCSRSSLKPEFVDKNFFNSTFGRDAIHQGCAVLVKNLREPCIGELLENESDHRPFVLLDQVTDPQNVGGILRAAAVFGARAVVVQDRNSPELTPAIAKVASGAIETVPLIRVANLVGAISSLKKRGFWCVGLDEKSEQKIQEISLLGNFVFVIGSEGGGIRRLTRESCDFLVHLPAFGNFTTLNAAQAATIALYEFLRQNQNNVEKR